MCLLGSTPATQEGHPSLAPPPCTRRDTCTALPNPSTLSASAAAMLLSQVSRGSTASAIPRQVSLQSNLPHLYGGESELPSSPRVWEGE